MLETSLQATQRTRTAHALDPTWNQKFEFDEIGGGEYLKIKCFSEETFGDDNIGSARVNLEGLVEGTARDVWIPLEKVNSGELRLQIEAVRVEDSEGARVWTIKHKLDKFSFYLIGLYYYSVSAVNVYLDKIDFFNMLFFFFTFFYSSFSVICSGFSDGLSKWMD